jgi:alkylation response protein AidB-like acyl-CoA dehydrogenase
MDLNFTPEDLAFRDRVRQWFAAHTPPEPLTMLEERRAWHRKMYEAGFVGMGWPKAYGGQDARPLEQATVSDELTRAHAPIAINGVGILLIGPTLIHHGTPAQKERFLKKLLMAEELWCQLYSEPNAGSDLASLQTRAEDKGDYYEINGQKVWTSYGELADWGLLLARTDSKAAKHQGISCFLINMRQAGIVVRPLKQITGTLEFCEVFLTNARVEKEHLVGPLHQGWQIAQTTLGYERGARTLDRVTAQRMSLLRLIEVTKNLKRDERAAYDDPLVRQKLGRTAVELEVMRYVGLRMLSRLEKGQRPGPESSIDKLVYSEFDKRYHEGLMEILGPYGGILEGMPEELKELGVTGDFGRQGLAWGIDFLRARAPTIAAGSSEIQKNIIGERVLGLPKEVRADRMEVVLKNKP